MRRLNLVPFRFQPANARRATQGKAGRRIPGDPALGDRRLARPADQRTGPAGRHRRGHAGIPRRRERDRRLARRAVRARAAARDDCSRTLFADWKTWCEGNGEDPETNQQAQAPAGKAAGPALPARDARGRRQRHRAEIMKATPMNRSIALAAETGLQCLELYTRFVAHERGTCAFSNSVSAHYGWSSAAGRALDRFTTLNSMARVVLKDGRPMPYATAPRSAAATIPSRNDHAAVFTAKANAAPGADDAGCLATLHRHSHGSACGCCVKHWRSQSTARCHRKFARGTGSVVALDHKDIVVA